MSHRLLSFSNNTKLRLELGEPALGLFVLSGSPFIMEACSTLPLDWLLIDAEASPVGKESIAHMIVATAASDVSPLVRVPWLERHYIEHVLDLGAHGVLVPKVDSVEMARQAVEYSHYPPQGRRGINPVRASAYFTDVSGYLAHANARTLCMVQVESAEAVRASQDIAAVDGVDVLFIGPGDLASALGQAGVVTGPAMDDARRRVLQATRLAGKTAGIFAYSLELAREYVSEGFRFVAVGNDIKMLKAEVQNTLDLLREVPHAEEEGRHEHFPASALQSPA